MALMTYREANQVIWRGVRPAHNGTQHTAIGYMENAAAAFYTVGAGDTFFLCTATLGYQLMAAGSAYMRVRTDAAAVYYNLVYDVVQAASFGNSKSVYFWPPMELPAGYDIFLSTDTAGLKVVGQVFGWVE